MNPWMPFLVPAAQARLMGTLTTIALQSQAIIGMRMAGMMGLATQAPDEQARMIAEKHEAASEAWVAMATAAMGGHGVERIINAGLAPYGQRTAANSKRLMAPQAPKRR